MQTVGQALECLQNLTNAKISQEEFGKALGTGRANISLRIKNNSKLTREEIEKLEKYFKVEYKEIHSLSLDEVEALKSGKNFVTLDYFPDIEVSCGNGIIPFGETKEKITVPVNLIRGYSKNNKYVIVSATSDSMQPEIKPNDMLIIRVTDSDTIIDNHIYVFCYNERLYCKYLSYNVNQIIVRSANKDYPTRFIEKENINDFKLCGEVCGLMRDLR